jgi:hypothetical protein
MILHPTRPLRSPWQNIALKVVQSNGCDTPSPNTNVLFSKKFLYYVDLRQNPDQASVAELTMIRVKHPVLGSVEHVSDDPNLRVAKRPASSIKLQQ